MSEEFSDSDESECSIDGVENEPMFAVLSQFLVTNKNKNIAQVFADIATELKQINVSLNAIADLQKSAINISMNTNNSVNSPKNNNAINSTQNST